jgi:bifunctional DNase/RNase
MTEKKEDERFIEMQLRRIVIRENSEQQYIYLVEKDGARSFPIVIGTSEAFEIRRVVCGVQTERPLTHQLAHDLIKGLGGTLVGVNIVDLKNNTFYAKLLVEQDGDGDIRVIDTRPSDAVALAMRAECPLRVAESVLAEARNDAGQDDISGELLAEDPSQNDDDASKPEDDDASKPETDDPSKPETEEDES